MPLWDNIGLMAMTYAGVNAETAIAARETNRTTLKINMNLH